MVRAGTRGDETGAAPDGRPTELQARTGRRVRSARSAVIAMGVALTVVVALLLQGAVAQAAPEQPMVERLESDGVWLINQTRGAYGLGAVGQDPWLTILARVHAENLAASNSLWHQNLKTPLSWGWRWVGENVAYSSAGLVDAHKALEGSPGHLANMIQPGATAAGVGLAWGSGRIFEVQLLAS